MSDRKPPPLFPPRKRDRCPVCGEISYSRAGIHPQCLVRKADEKHNNRIKREKPTVKTVKPSSHVTPWQKTCPKCKALQHVQKKECRCGHKFAVRARPPTCGGESS